TIETGAAKVALAREDGSWKLKAPAGQAAEDEAVRKWIEDVGAYRAVELVPANADAKKQGLSHPTVVTIETETGGKEVLKMGEAASGRRNVRRGDEPVVLAVHAELGAQVRPDPLLFRARRVLSFVRFDARRLSARQGGVEEVAEKGEGDN